MALWQFHVVRSARFLFCKNLIDAPASERKRKREWMWIVRTAMDKSTFNFVLNRARCVA